MNPRNISDLIAECFAKLEAGEVSDRECEVAAILIGEIKRLCGKNVDIEEIEEHDDLIIEAVDEHDDSDEDDGIEKHFECSDDDDDDDDDYENIDGNNSKFIL